MTFLFNLWALGGKLPAIIAIIRALVDIVGSDRVQKFLQTFKDALNSEADKLPGPPTTEPVRARLLDRVRQRLALQHLGMTEDQYVAFCDVRGVSGPIV